MAFHKLLNNWLAEHTPIKPLFVLVKAFYVSKMFMDMQKNTARLEIQPSFPTSIGYFFS